LTQFFVCGEFFLLGLTGLGCVGFGLGLVVHGSLLGGSLWDVVPIFLSMPAPPSLTEVKHRQAVEKQPAGRYPDASYIFQDT
jgi:hypothetical protein